MAGQDAERAGGDAVESRPDDGSRADGLIRPAGPLLAIGGLVLVLVAVLALREVASLVVPVMFGLFIALTAWPMVAALERRGVRHAFALAATIVVVLAVGFVAACVAALSVGELAVAIPTYESRLSAALAALRDLLAQLGISSDLGAITAIISPEKIFGLVKPVASAVSEAGGAMFVLAFTMIYALAGGTSLRARAVAAFGEQHALLLGMERFGTDLRRYLVVRTELGLFAAVLSFVLLFVLDVPFPVLWAILVFAASFVPNIGTFIAVIPPTLLAYLDSGLGTAVMVVIGYRPHQLRPGPVPPAGGHGERAQPEPAGRLHRGRRVGVDPRPGRRAPRGPADGRADHGPRGVSLLAGLCGRAPQQRRGAVRDAGGAQALTTACVSRPPVCVVAALAGTSAGRRTRLPAPPRRRGQQPKIARPFDRLGASMDAELLVDVAHVGLDGARGDEQLPGDVRCRQVARQVAKDAKLALAERLGQGRQLSQAGWRRSGKHAADVGQQGGVSRSVARVPIEEVLHGRDEEREDDGVGLGQLERTLDVRFRGGRPGRAAAGRAHREAAPGPP